MKTNNNTYFIVVIAIHFVSTNSFSQSPISLHPDNPHYFLYKGKPTVLISSAEHYGAALNADIDYKKYLATLQDFGFNQTRMFSGFYCEGREYDSRRKITPSWEEIQNTLAPRPGKFITPWKMKNDNADRPVYDLDQWNEKYFTRVKDFLREAADRNVIVEIVLFTAIYSPDNWNNSPLNPKNNGNATGKDIPYNEIHLPQHAALRARELAMVEKIVREVNAFDNIYFEICNEPYWLKGIPENSTITEQQFLPEIATWENEIAKKIRATEFPLPRKHLIAQNIANTYKKVDAVDQNVSVLNFHYSFPPKVVADNHALQKPLAFDETADGCNAPDRRREAWAFMMAGGAVYSNLDWSFSNDDISGLGRNPAGRAVSGKEVRDQLKVLAQTINGFDFVHARPIVNEVKNSTEDLLGYGLTIVGKDYLIYFLKQKSVTPGKTTISLPAGKYSLQFSDPLDGKLLSAQIIDHQGGDFVLPLPAFQDDLLVRVMTTDRPEKENK